MPEKPKLYPGPYAIEFTFQAPVGTVILEHSIELNCIVVGEPVAGDPMSAIALQKAGGGTQTAFVSVNDFWAQYRLGLATTQTVSSVILWKYTPLSYEKQFISAMATSLGAGTGGGGLYVAHQTQITLRSAKGSYLRVNWLEDNSPTLTTTSLAPLATGNAQQRVAAYLLSTNGWAVARDGSFPVAAMKVSGTENEAIARKRYRPNL